MTIEPNDGRLDMAVAAMLERLAEAERVASRSVPLGPHRLANLDRALPALHRRIRRSARAVHMLLTAAHPFEAAVVARALFEDSLKLGWLRRAGDKRTHVLLGWMSSSTSHAERMLRLGAQTGASSLSEVTDALAVRRSFLATEKARLGARSRLASFPAERSMAEALDRLDEFHAYLFATQVTHGAETAFIFDPDPVGDLTNELATPSTQVAGAALTLSVTPTLRAHIDVAQMLGWHGATEAQALLDAPLPGL